MDTAQGAELRAVTVVLHVVLEGLLMSLEEQLQSLEAALGPQESGLYRALKVKLVEQEAEPQAQEVELRVVLGAQSLSLVDPKRRAAGPKMQEAKP